MEKFDAIIIGGGLGGLQCGYILSKHGMNVCVLEKNARPGGCIQTFRRAGVAFDTGFHYVGGLSEGQPLNRLFHYFGLMDLPWRQLDEDCSDEVVIGGKSYSFATGYGRFAETLSQQFPHQRKNLASYAKFLQSVSDNIFDSFTKKSEEYLYGASLFAKPAYGYLSAAIDDPLLRNVLAGASLKMELDTQTLPLYVFAQINSSFIQSAWRLQGGGSLIADSLAKSVKEMGGTVRTNAEATALVEKGGKIVEAEINGNERIEAEYFVADMHPAAVLPLIKESSIIRSIYRKRISDLAGAFGMFSVNIALKEGTTPYQNKNIYIYKTSDLWRLPENLSGEIAGALVSYQVPQNGSAYARNIDILTPMKWQEVERWANTKTGRRGDDYVSFKNRKMEECIGFVSSQLPDLKDNIERAYTSTPLSYRDYVGAPRGSAYGVRKNCEQLMTTLLSPRTPEPNLFLTGQNLNLHGVLGVSMTSFMTCAQIIGMDAATQGLDCVK